MRRDNLLLHFVLISILGVVARGPYREFVYTNGIADFGLADCLPNFLYVLHLSITVVWLTQRIPRLAKAASRVSSIASVTLGTILYEMDQIGQPGRTFDWKDILASLLAGILAYLIWGRVGTTSGVQNNPAQTG